MILPFLTFLFGLWQVLTLQYVHSEKVRFIVGMTAICLSAIPLIIQFVILMDELRRAKQHFLRLLLHRFLMTVLGDHGPALNLVAKYYSLYPTNLKYAKDIRAARLAVTDLVFPVRVMGPFRAVSSLVFGAVVFGDAFSGMYNTRRVSTALWLDSEDDQWGLPVEGESEWAEKRWEEIKMREIVGLKSLRSIRRTEEEVYVEGGGDGEDRSEQMKRWNKSLRRLEGWLAAVRLLNAHFMRIYITMLLLIESIMDWLITRRIIAMMSGESRGDEDGDGAADGDGRANGDCGGDGENRDEQMNIWSIWLRWLDAVKVVDEGNLSELLRLLRRSKTLEGFKGLERSEYMDWLEILYEAGWEELERAVRRKYKLKIVSQLPISDYNLSLWERVEVFKQFTLFWQLNQEMSKPVVQVENLENLLVQEMSKPVVQVENLENLLVQPNKSKTHAVSKVIRQAKLSVTFYPANASKLRYHILATGSQDNFASSLYGESFFGYCTCEAAVEFCKLMEALDNDSFVVTSKPSKSKGEILSCERLDIIVKSILKDGKKVNAEKIISASYVYTVMIVYLGDRAGAEEPILRSGMMISPPGSWVFFNHLEH